MELDLAIKIYNQITDINHSINGTNFEITMAMYSVPNVRHFWEYMATIKETILNFDSILDAKINTPEVKAMQALIDSIGVSK